jgi:ApbE superfamily uncharacterized protein (UPF0280 family)
LINDHTALYPTFKDSLDPLSFPADIERLPPELSTMYRCGHRTGTGPMSSVAGLFAEGVANLLNKLYNPAEMVVENGGDLYVKCSSNLVSVIHAGNSVLSDKMGLILPPGEWGICTSSGTQGHSFSKGKADAVTVVSDSVPMADAWATALANRVMGPEDIESVMDQVSEIPEILSCVVIAGEKIGIRGRFEVKLLS